VVTSPLACSKPLWTVAEWMAAGALLADAVRVLGPDHPDTLATRHNLAYLRGKAGDSAGAAAAFEAPLADRLRLLGPDHPDTLTTRHNLSTEIPPRSRLTARLRQRLAETVARSNRAVSGAVALSYPGGPTLQIFRPDRPRPPTGPPCSPSVRRRCPD
jgi:hypothetical protein